MLRFYKYQNNSSIEGVKNKWFLRIKHGETVDLEGLAKHMAEHNSPFSEGLIYGVLKDMTRCIEELLLDSKKVKIGDLGIFYLGVNCKGAADAESCTVDNVRNLSFKCLGTGATRSVNLKQKVHYREMDQYSV